MPTEKFNGVFIFQTEIDERIIKHGRIRAGDKTGAKSQDQFSREKAPESVRKAVDDKTAGTDDRSQQDRCFPAKNIGKIARRNFKQKNADGENGLQDHHLGLIQSVIIKKQNQDGHNE